MGFVQNISGKSLIVFGLLLLSCVVALAQTPTPTTESGGEKAQAIVKLNAIIMDEAGRSVTDVRREDVRVTEDGVAQTVTLFAQEVRPVSYGLVIDTTGSMRSLLTQVIETGRAIISENRPGDESFVMHYVDSDTIEMDTGWTPDKEALLEALDELFIQGGLTATLDAMHRALGFTTRPRSSSDDNAPRRRALVLITDGEDRGSQQSNPEMLLSRLRNSDVQVFIIGLTKLSDARNRDKSAALLTRIAQESGGRVFFPKSVSELGSVVKELTHDLRTQYVIGYSPTNAKRDGSFRKVQVTLATGKNKRNVLTRAGYNASQ